jgi:tetratricopeptide (TPR) repeat protein
MSLRLRCLALVLLLGLGSSGCSPTAETQSVEQNNPHFRAGKEKLAALDYRGAIESFERALEDNPRSGLAHFELGVLYEQRENDYAAALYHYNKVLKLRPDEYPAGIIRQRIPACKQELLKADSLAVFNPSAFRDTERLREEKERLREENTALRKQLALLQAQAAQRPVAVAQGNSPIVTPAAPRDAFRDSPIIVATRTNAPFHGGTTDRARSATPAGSRTRTHSVKAGETAFSISRQYGIKADALLSANPGLNPKRLRVGQVLNIPAS